MKALVALCLLAICCGVFEKADTYADGGHEPASVAESEVAIIYVGQFATDDDFYYSVKEQIMWLISHNYTVEKLCFEYGNDMTQHRVLRCAIITYKEVKNE